MFLHLSVILSTGRSVGPSACWDTPPRQMGGVCPSACWDTHTHPWETPTGQTPPRADTLRADTPPPADSSPQKTATAVGGTHPTGMHSCCLMIVVPTKCEH